jgi:hypothetical protein
MPKDTAVLDLQRASKGGRARKGAASSLETDLRSGPKFEFRSL